ncbi:hypothetical protein MCOR25_003644 [Pyricularia grisea]|nr:hypothetical protein MCOR25_003644 [Pyricularia grisea]
MTPTDESDNNAMHLLLSQNSEWQSDGDYCIHLQGYNRPLDAALKKFRLLMEDPNGHKLHQGVNWLGNKPIHTAFWSMQSEPGLLHELLDPKWALDIWEPNSDGNTTLHLACDSGSGEGVRLLLARDDVDVNCKNNKGQTPLHMACDWDRPIVWSCPGYNFGEREHGDKKALMHDYFDDPQLVRPVELLLGHSSIDLSARDEEGRTALHLASYYRNAETAKLLIERGADVNARDDNQETPLYWLVIGVIKRPEWTLPVRKPLRTLLEAGADPEAKDAKGKTPAEFMASFGGKDAFSDAVEAGNIKKDGEDSNV